LLSLGTYPFVPLSEARQKRDDFRSLLADDIDPSRYRQQEKMTILAKEARRLTATRFILECDGGLSIKLGKRCFALSPAETIELRSFLDANQ